MFKTKVEDIFLEIESVGKENNLLENIKMIYFSCHSSRLDDFRIYLKNVIERISHLQKEDFHYSLYIFYYVILFLKIIKDDNPNIFFDDDVFKLTTLFFYYGEKILKQKKCLKTENIETKKEINKIILETFRLEFYFRKNKRLIPKQYDLNL
ncbi:MAG: hypothetical protein A2086_15965 [Spirochaetes bacterium GWD1_27_9]|nr:MAG: hypothetical protein A2Z98_11420 [Spirochaetes bacterium GWB1_27_13]OHD25113.1 MAG: hypothetical protein A2Y34_12300 [Spirochaetes bacterium GWC1_27_15]OHD36211.1 MAG: hypothetical protein A2086_15965 [Spirochaetes bacterium GWD1_27_9]